MSFDSILVANRGEIACRVLRAARKLGYRTIAVYSEADAGAVHPGLADESVLLGPAPAAESYLDIGRILEAADRSGAGAIHPGYGFLSENAAFARACTEAGRVFIGPPAEAIELMGDKARARRRMIEAGVPCIPGYEGEAQDADTLAAEAGRIGFPVMVKAAAGGGGRGMRRVVADADLADALRQARAEAENAFGCGDLILEKAMQRPRHVEIQVLADSHGNVIHLGERDCSVQRRHQKVIEESPCPVMTAALRQAMGAAAVEAAACIGYSGAGTVEFLLDESGAFYFLEMNTRLQVEHPVTEAVTGCDLVALQIAVARGEPLPLRQEDIRWRGHAIEARLYAEDPDNDFMPGSGRIELWRPPAGTDIRVDDGIASGLEVSPFYDAMVAKVIAWGETREGARLRLLRALQETALFGPVSNRDFLLRALEDAAFVDGVFTTDRLDHDGLDADAADTVPLFHLSATAAVLDYRAAMRRALENSVAVSRPLLNWSNAGPLRTPYRFGDGEAAAELVVAARGGSYAVTGGDASCIVEVRHDDGVVAEITIDGASHRVIYCTPAAGETWLALGNVTRHFVNRLAAGISAAERVGSGRIVAPMHGQLTELCVAAGDAVSRGQRLLVLEAMKMQHEILADVDGKVRAVHAASGEQIAADALLVEIEPAEASD